MVSRCIEFLFQEGVRSRPGPGQLSWQIAVTAQRDLMKAASSRPGYEGTTCCLAGVMGGVKTALKKGFWWRPLPICRGCPGKARLMRRDETPGAVCHLCATAKACVWTAFGESCNENSRLPHAKPVSGLIRRDPWCAYGCWSVVWRRSGRNLRSWRSIVVRLLKTRREAQSCVGSELKILVCSGQLPPFRPLHPLTASVNNLLERNADPRA